MIFFEESTVYNQIQMDLLQSEDDVDPVDEVVNEEVQVSQLKLDEKSAL